MDSWYVILWGHELGPLPFSGLKFLADSGRIHRQDRVRSKSGPWVPANTVQGLFPHETHLKFDCQKQDARERERQA